MDLEKIGGFLAALRKEQGLTQEQLGQLLGVTNKTVSRWEKGNYLPPAEMLKALSERYGVSINELLSGERLTAADYQQKAEENIRSALAQSTFTIEEQKRFFKRKWRREHLPGTILAMAFFGLFYWYGLMEQEGWNVLAVVGMFAFLIWRNNQMMIYVEHHVYDQPEQQTAPMGEWLYRYLRMILLALLVVSILALVDLGDNLLYSMIPELNDGITLRGSFSRLFFGDEGWSRAEYFHGFSRVMRLTAWLGVGNLLFAMAERGKK